MNLKSFLKMCECVDYIIVDDDDYYTYDCEITVDVKNFNNSNDTFTSLRDEILSMVNVKHINAVDNTIYAHCDFNILAIKLLKNKFFEDLDEYDDGTATQKIVSYLAGYASENMLKDMISVLKK